MSDKFIGDFPAAAALDGSEGVPVVQAGDVALTTAADIAALAASVIRIDLFASAVSTPFDATLSKRIVGRRYFDPSASKYKLKAGSTATLYVLLETTNASMTAHADLLRETGVGAPTIVATLTPTASLTPALLTADVSAAFVNTANAGNFAIEIWIDTANGADFASCSGAWIEIQP